MSFIVVKRDPDGTHTHSVEGASLQIGWAPDNALQLLDRRLSEHHASLELQADRCVLRDLGSTAGTFLNGRRVTESALADGDRIEIGPYLLTVRLSPDRPLRIEVERTATEATPRSEDKADGGLSNTPLSKAKLGVAGVLVVLAATILASHLGHGTALAPGSLSAAHSQVACSSCHSPWHEVPDRNCQACHRADLLLDHAANPHHASPNMEACARCHVEHRGSRSVVVPRELSGRCVQCHPQGSTGEGHPEVRSKPEKAHHWGYAEFNHATHLKQAHPRGGTRTLQCLDCHTTTDQYRTFESPTFDKNCLECHADSGWLKPELRYRVQESDTVSQIARDFGVAEDDLREANHLEGDTLTAGWKMAIPFKPVHHPSDPAPATEKAAEAWRGVCGQCHRISTGVADETFPARWITEDQKAYGIKTIDPVRERGTHTTHSQFVHKPHLAVTDCNTCHQAGTGAFDMSLPTIQTCGRCHNGNPDAVSNQCSQCHWFHDSSRPARAMYPANQALRHPTSP